MRLQGDETTDRVLRLLAEIAVAHCLGSELPLGGPRPGALNFIAVDSFVRLLCTLIRCAPCFSPRLFGTGGAPNIDFKRAMDLRISSDMVLVTTKEVADGRQGGRTNYWIQAL